jgi:hypothetical protein
MISLAYQNTVFSPFRIYAWKTLSTAATVVCRWYTRHICGYRAAGERSARQRHLAKPDRGSSNAAGIGRYRPAREDWYDISWNPIAGCSAVSRGCDNCWAMRVAAQLVRMGGSSAARYTGLTRMRGRIPSGPGKLAFAMTCCPGRCSAGSRAVSPSA